MLPETVAVLQHRLPIFFQSASEVCGQIGKNYVLAIHTFQWILSFISFIEIFIEEDGKSV